MLKRMNYQTLPKSKRIHPFNLTTETPRVQKPDRMPFCLMNKNVQDKRTYITSTKHQINIQLQQSLSRSPSVYPAYDNTFIFMFPDKQSSLNSIMHIDQNSSIKKRILTSSNSLCMISEYQIILLEKVKNLTINQDAQEDKFSIIKTWNIKLNRSVIYKHRKFDKYATQKMIYYPKQNILCVLETKQLIQTQYIQSNTSNSQQFQTKITCYKFPLMPGHKPFLKTFVKHSHASGVYGKINQKPELGVYDLNKDRRILHLKVLSLVEPKITQYNIDISSILLKECSNYFDWIQMTDIWQSAEGIIQFKAKAYHIQNNNNLLWCTETSSYFQKGISSYLFQFYVNCSERKVYSYDWKQIPNRNQLNEIENRRKVLHILLSNDKQQWFYHYPDYDPGLLFIYKFQSSYQTLKCMHYKIFANL